MSGLSDADSSSLSIPMSCSVLEVIRDPDATANLRLGNSPTHGFAFIEHPTSLPARYVRLWFLNKGYSITEYPCTSLLDWETRFPSRRLSHIENGIYTEGRLMHESTFAPPPEFGELQSEARSSFSADPSGEVAILARSPPLHPLLPVVHPQGTTPIPSRPPETNPDPPEATRPHHPGPTHLPASVAIRQRNAPPPPRRRIPPPPPRPHASRSRSGSHSIGSRGSDAPGLHANDQPPSTTPSGPAQRSASSGSSVASALTGGGPIDPSEVQESRAASLSVSLRGDPSGSLGGTGKLSSATQQSAREMVSETQQSSAALSLRGADSASAASPSITAPSLHPEATSVAPSIISGVASSQAPSSMSSVSHPSVEPVPSTVSVSESAVTASTTSVASPSPPTTPDLTSLAILEKLTSILEKPSSEKIRLPKFDGKDADRWPAFNAALNIAMEHPDYSPAMKGRLLTTDANLSASKKIRILINNSLLPPEADKFYDAPEFIDRGFEMVEHLRDNWSSNTEEDTFVNFLSLIDLTQRPGETVPSYSSRIRSINSRIKAGEVDLPPALISMLMMRGLEDRYDELKKRYAANPKESWGADCLSIERMCSRFVTTNQSLFGNVDSPPAASSTYVPKSHTPRVGAQPPPSTATSTYPPSQPPTMEQVHAVIDHPRKCAICHQKHKEVKCDALAQKGMVVLEDAAAATLISQEVKEIKARAALRNGAPRGAGRGRGEQASERKADKAKRAAAAAAHGTDEVASGDAQSVGYDSIDSAELAAVFETADGEYIEVGRGGKDAKANPKSGSKSYLVASISSVAAIILKQLADGSIVRSRTLSR